MQLATWNRLSFGTTYLHRLDGRIKTIVLLSAVITVTVLTNWFLVAGVLLATLALFFTLHMPVKRLLLRLSIPFGVAWLVLLSLIFTNGHTVIEVIHFKFVSLSVYREGVALGFLIMLRILAAVSLAMLLSVSTPMVEILATLRSLKVPGLIVDLADMTYRYAFLLEEIAVNMRKAQRVRGGEGLPWYVQARDVGMVAGNLLVKALDRSVRIYKAMLARGYDEDAKTLPYFTRPVPGKDLVAGVSAGLVLLALIVCNVAVAWKGWS